MGVDIVHFRRDHLLEQARYGECTVNGPSIASGPAVGMHAHYLVPGPATAMAAATIPLVIEAVVLGLIMAIRIRGILA
ncbi:hypothetical protein NKI72_17695 [Mesorhizobium sp. M0437]|uniref:hypothetical protein n=1 Tax=unclassified Mesorhizobium TaxID=325217 RepID=UPI0033365CDF